MAAECVDKEIWFYNLVSFSQYWHSAESMLPNRQQFRQLNNYPGLIASITTSKDVLLKYYVQLYSQIAKF